MTIYELDPSTNNFLGERAQSLEIAYQEKLIELGWQRPVSRRQWYDMNIWGAHAPEFRPANPFLTTYRKGVKLST